MFSITHCHHDVVVIASGITGKILANLIAKEVPVGIFLCDKPEVALHLLNIGEQPPRVIFFMPMMAGVDVMERLACFKKSQKQQAPTLILLGKCPKFRWFRRNFCLLDSALVLPFTTRQLRRLLKKYMRSLSISQGDFHA